MIFQDANGEWLRPTMIGGSAGLNSAMFFACPLCGAVVLDMHHDAGNRIRHDEWHRPLLDAGSRCSDSAPGQDVAS